MIEDNYFDEFLGDDTQTNYGKKEELPSWVSNNNNSLPAYRAIEKMNKEKEAFIKRNGLQSLYVRKANYHISKSVIARMVGCAAQPLFHSAKYSKHLEKHLNKINKELVEKKEKRLRRGRGGVNYKQRKTLVKDYQKATKGLKELQHLTVDEVYKKTIDNLSLDIKIKLKLL